MLWCYLLPNNSINSQHCISIKNTFSQGHYTQVEIIYKALISAPKPSIPTPLSSYFTCSSKLTSFNILNTENLQLSQERLPMASPHSSLTPMSIVLVLGSLTETSVFIAGLMTPEPMSPWLEGDRFSVIFSSFWITLEAGTVLSYIIAPAQSHRLILLSAVLPMLAYSFICFFVTPSLDLILFYATLVILGFLNLGVYTGLCFTEWSYEEQENDIQRRYSSIELQGLWLLESFGPFFFGAGVLYGPVSCVWKVYGYAWVRL